MGRKIEDEESALSNSSKPVRSKKGSRRKAEDSAPADPAQDEQVRVLSPFFGVCP